MANPTELTSIFSTLIKEINEAGQSDLLKGSIGSIKDLQSVLKEQDKLIDKTLRAGDEKSAMRLLKAAKQAQEAQVEATENLREAKEKLLKLDQEGNAKGRDAQLKVIGKINQEINRLAREAKLMQKNAAEFGKGAEYSMEKYSRVLQNREERIKELGKTGAIFEEKFANRFEGAVNAFTSGVGDIESFGETFAGGLKLLGTYLLVRKGKSEEKGAMGKGGLGVANMLGGLSKVVSTLAIVGGSIMMLVKLFKMVEGTVIEANKALLDGGVAINDLYNVGMGDTQKNLEKIRDTFRDPSFANAMGIPLADTMALVAGFNQLNMGIKQFGGGEAGMVKMKEAMKDAKGMAFGLGISMDEAQQYMAKFTHDLGVSAKDGSIIGKMAGDFANIRDMALQSSYSTGNFFKKVTELTDQLDNMNYRTKEAGTLVLRFASVLGKSGLDKALQSLFSGFRGEGYLEQMRRNMMAKSEEVKKALKVEAIKFAKAFKESFGGEDGEGGMNALLMERVGAKDEKDLIKKLATLNEKERQNLFTEMKQQEGVTEEFTDQLYKFIRLARGTKDKATGAEVQGAQEEMGATGNLRTKFALIQARIGDRDINDAGVVTKEMLTKFNVTKEQIEAFAQLQTTMKGDLRRAQELVKNKTDIKDLSEEDQTFLEEQGLSLKDGQLIMAETQLAVKNFSDYLQAQDEAKFKDLKPEEAAKTQEQYLDEGVKATTSVFNVLNNTIAGILNTISTGIYKVVEALFGESLNEKEKRIQREIIEDLSKSMENAQAQEKEAGKRVRSLQKQVDADKFVDTEKMTDKDRKKFERESAARKEELAKAKAEQAKFKERAQLDRETIQELQVNASQYAGTFSTASREEFIEGARETVLGKTGAGKLGEFRRSEEADMQAFQDEFQGRIKLSDAAGGKEYQIKSYKDLQKYLSDATEFDPSGVDKKVLELMAKLKLEFKQKVEKESKRKGETRILDESLVKEGQGEVAGGKRQTRESTQIIFGESFNRTTSRSPESDLSQQTLKSLKEPVPKVQRDREAKEEVKATEKQQIEIQTKAIIEAAKETKEKEVKAVAKALNLSSNASADKIATAFDKATPKQIAKLKALGIGGNETVNKLLGRPTAPTAPTVTKVDENPTKDILITSDGQVWKLDRQDQFTPMSGGGYAMSKPGGAIDEYIGKRMGTGGGSFTITVNVNGAKNPVETSRQVVQEIRKAQDALTGGTR